MCKNETISVDTLKREKEILEKKNLVLRTELRRIEKATLYQRIKYFITGKAIQE